MAAGDINDPLSNIPNIVLVDQSAATAAPGAGYGRLEVVNGVLGVRVGSGAWVALASLVAGLLTALTEKVTPADTDLVLLQDEADASALKKVQVSNLPGGGEATIPDPVDWSGTLTLTQSGAVSFTARQAYYHLIGKTCHVYVILSITGSGTGNNVLTVGGLPAPAAPAVTAYDTAVGCYGYTDAGVAISVGIVRVHAGPTFDFVIDGAGNAFGVTPNIACANGDTLAFTASYLVA